MQPNEEQLNDEEIEVYGVDWEGLRDDQLLQSQRLNNAPAEGAASWIGRVGPPNDLSQVTVDAPDGPLSAQEIHLLQTVLHQWMGSGEEADIIHLWNHGLAYARAIYPHLF